MSAWRGGMKWINVCATTGEATTTPNTAEKWKLCQNRRDFIHRIHYSTNINSAITKNYHGKKVLQTNYCNLQLEIAIIQGNLYISNFLEKLPPTGNKPSEQ